MEGNAESKPKAGKVRVTLLKDNIEKYYLNIYTSLQSSVGKQVKIQDVTLENAANAATEAIKLSNFFRMDQVASGDFIPSIVNVEKGYMKRLEGKEERVRMKLDKTTRDETIELTMDDIEAALKTMKPTKIGQDGVPYAAWTHGGDMIKEIIYKICNGVWLGNGIPDAWKQYRIFVVADSELHRTIGIVIVHSISLIYRKVLGHKLLKEMDNKHMLSHNQTGNRVGFSCLHHLYVLNYLVGRELATEGGKVVAFFAHFANAFDSIDRKKMMNILVDKRVESMLRERIEELYEETIDTISVQRGKTGKAFWATKGLVQGCPLSPRLFNLYVSDLEAWFQKEGIGGLKLGSKTVFFTAYTNCIVLLAKDETTMQEMIKVFARYVQAKDLIVNTTKSEVMIFTEIEKKSKVDFKWNKKTICQVEEIDHLGYRLMKDGSSEMHVKRIMQKLNGKIKGLIARERKSKNSFEKQMQLFDDMVGSHMFGVQIWGWEEIDELEALQVEYIRKLKNLSNKLSDEDVRKAGKRCEMQVLTGKRALKWERRLANLKPDSLAAMCLKEIEKRSDEVLKAGDGGKMSLWEIDRHNFLISN